MKKYRVTISTRGQHYFLSVCAVSVAGAMQEAIGLLRGDIGMIYISAKESGK